MAKSPSAGDDLGGRCHQTRLLGLLPSRPGYARDMSNTQDPIGIVITGATSGVGRATARRFAREGCSIALLARGTEGLEATVAEVERLGGQAVSIPTDVSDPDQVASAADVAESRLGGIDVWINNAMTTVFSFFEDCEPEEFRRATEVTYLGTVWGTREALRHMEKRGDGVIIQVGSALAYRGIPLQAAYCGSKHAILGFTESVRSELLHNHSKIHLGMVQLPAVNTPQFSHCRSKFDKHPMPVPPIYQPEVAADAVHLAVTERRREIYVGYPTILTILGNKVSSAALDEYLAHSGVESQLADAAPDPENEKGNLLHPVHGDPGAHGMFDDRARSFSPALWLSKNRKQVGIAMSALVATLLLRR